MLQNFNKRSIATA